MRDSGAVGVEDKLMQKTSWMYAAAVAIALVGTAPALAHHSFAMFDRSITKSVTGTVLKFEWTNPHTWIWINASDATGKVVAQGFELNGGPPSLSRRGWTKRTINPGDKVTVTYHVLRSGQLGGEFVSIALPNGDQFDLQGKVPPGGRAQERPFGVAGPDAAKAAQ